MAASVWPLLELGAEMPAWGPVAGRGLSLVPRVGLA